MSALVTDDMVSAALEYLSRSTVDSSKAKADRVMAEHNRKRVRAMMILDSDQTTATLREADAEASQAYYEACQAEREAVERDEYHRAARIKADAIISAWQTENANNRAAERVR